MESTRKDTRRYANWQMTELERICKSNERRIAMSAFIARKFQKRVPRELSFTEMKEVLKLMDNGWQTEYDNILHRDRYWEKVISRKASGKAVG